MELTSGPGEAGHGKKQAGAEPPSSWSAGRPTLRRQLMVLFFLAIVPSILIALLISYSDYVEDKLNLDHQILMAAESVATEHQRVNAEGQRLVRLAAQAPALREGTACGPFLRQLLDQFPQIANFSVTRADGRPECSARPLDPAHVFDAALIRDALRHDALASTGYQYAPATQSISVDLAYRIPGSGTGSRARVLIATLTMDWFYAHVTALRLPKGSTAVLVDTGGGIIAHYPDASHAVGDSMPDAPIVRAALDVARGGQVQAQKVDGVSTRFVSLPLPALASEGLLYLGIAAPADVLYESATRSYLADFALLALSALLTVSAISWGSRRFVLRPVHELLGVIGRQKSGDPQARATVGGVREFAEFAGQLNELFDTQAAADSILRASEKARADAERIARSGNWSWDIGKDAVVWAFGGGPLTGPLSMEVALTSHVHPEDQQEFRIAISNAALDKRPFHEEFRWLPGEGPERIMSISGEGETDGTGKVVRLVGSVQDITARRRAEAALRLTSSAVEASSNGILIVDARQHDHPVVYANAALLRVTGYEAADFIGRNCRFLQGDDRAQPGIEQIRIALREGRETEVVLRNYRKDGSLFWNHLRISPLKNERGVVTHFMGIQNDISDMKAYEAALERQANYDGLTGLPNRNLLTDRLTVALADARRASRQVALLWLNIDRFQRINESMGRSAGDWILKTVGERLQRKVRASDTVARLGGDEFGIALHDIDSPDAAALVARKVAEAVTDPITVSGQEVFLSCGIGIAMYPNDAQWVSALLANSEIAMTRAKRQPGSFGFYAAEMNSLAATRLELEAELRHAIERNELLLHYQPRVDMQTGAIRGVEALVRWTHPKRGLVSPAEFIPLAEETGLIVPMGEWILETACRQARAWRDAGYTELRMAVNLSPRQFRQPLLADQVRRILQQEGLPAGNLELEITETVAMDDPTQSRRIMHDLKAIGISLAVDDFGTGHSSLGYLSNFPIDFLKIDQSFVRGTPANAENAVIVRTVIALAHNLSLEVIAEGIETEEQRRFLQSEGCEEAQGYLFSKPLPAEEVVKQFRKAGKAGTAVNVVNVVNT